MGSTSGVSRTHCCASAMKPSPRSSRLRTRPRRWPSCSTRASSAMACSCWPTRAHSSARRPCAVLRSRRIMAGSSDPHSGSSAASAPRSSCSVASTCAVAKADSPTTRTLVGRSSPAWRRAKACSACSVWRAAAPSPMCRWVRTRSISAKPSARSTPRRWARSSSRSSPSSASIGLPSKRRRRLRTTAAVITASGSATRSMASKRSSSNWCRPAKSFVSYSAALRKAAALQAGSQ